MREVTDPAILAQLNGDKQGSPAGLRPVEDPNILAQLNGGQGSEKEQTPSISDRAMASFFHQQSPLGNTKNYDPGQNEYNALEKVGIAAMDYAPYLMGAGGAVKRGVALASKLPGAAEKIAGFAAKNPKMTKFLTSLGENTIGGAAYSGVNSDEDKLSNAVQGGLVGAGATTALQALNPVARYLGKKYVQSAIPEFTKAATDKLKKLLPVEEYSKMLTNKFLQSSEKNKQNWNVLENTAKGIDNEALENAPMVTKTIKKDTGLLDERGNPLIKEVKQTEKSPYFKNPLTEKYIKKYQNDVNSMEPSLKIPYEQAYSASKEALKSLPESFEGAIQASKNINQGIKDFLNDGGKAINPANRETKQFLSGLKSNIRNEAIESNKNNASEESINQLKDQWDLANKSHKAIQEFYKTPRVSTEVMKETVPVREMFKNITPETPLDPSIIGRYAPTLSIKGVKGVQGTKHLGKLLGDEQLAKDAVKAHLYNRPIEKGASTIDAAKIYSDMSPTQRKYFHGDSDEGKYLEAINKARLALGREPEKTLAKIGHGVLSWTLPGLLGGGATLASGEGWDKAGENALLATLAAKGVGKAASKVAGARSVNRAIDLAKNGTPFTGRYANLAAQNFMKSRREDNR